MFHEYILRLLSSYFSSALVSYWFFPFIALAFIATVPRILRAFFCWR